MKYIRAALSDTAMFRARVSPGRIRADGHQRIDSVALQEGTARALGIRILMTVHGQTLHGLQYLGS